MSDLMLKVKNSTYFVKSMKVHRQAALTESSKSDEIIAVSSKNIVFVQFVSDLVVKVRKPHIFREKYESAQAGCTHGII